MRTLSFLPLALAAAALGCSSPNGSNAQYWSPIAKAGSTATAVAPQEAGPPEAGPVGPVNTKGTVTFTATPVSYGGRYAPREVGAIWVDDANGAFVKTLLRWGYFRWTNLSRYRTETGSNMVDAVSAATAGSPMPQSGTWNYTDVSGNGVPDGQYQFVIEFAEDDAWRGSSSNGPSTAVPFKKGAGAASFNPPDASGFTAMSVTYQAP